MTKKALVLMTTSTHYTKCYNSVNDSIAPRALEGTTLKRKPIQKKNQIVFLNTFNANFLWDQVEIKTLLPMTTSTHYTKCYNSVNDSIAPKALEWTILKRKPIQQKNQIVFLNTFNANFLWDQVQIKHCFQ